MAGGYQPPANPAPVSGPGALSQRTDGGQPIRRLPDAAYGESKAFEDQQRGAPVAGDNGSPAVPQTVAPGPSGPPDQAYSPPPPQPVTPLFAPTQRPDEPVTAGAPLGPGPTSVSGGQFQPTPNPISSQLQQYVAGDSTGTVAWLATQLQQMGQ